MTFTGYDPKQEDWSHLSTLPYGLDPNIDYYEQIQKAKALQAPKEWMEVHRQSRNDCVGHGATACLELYHYQRTGKKYEFSRHYGYIATQRYNNGQWNGRVSDNGAIISDAAKLLLGAGVCQESDYPYPSRFVTEITSKHKQLSEPFKVESIRRMDSPEDVKTVLTSGQGAVIAGVPWGGGGYHCIAYVEWNDRDGFVHLNSHGSSYSQDGFGEDRDGSQIRRWWNDRWSSFWAVTFDKPQEFDWTKGGMAG